MKKKAFKMTLYQGQITEYKKRHKPIWKELKSVLKAHGVYNYSIFFDEETHTLFGYVEIESVQKWNEIANTEVCRKWWKYMSDIMQTNSNFSPKSSDLEEVFHIN
jgi:L-rhamnose mutarotase